MSVQKIHYHSLNKICAYGTALLDILQTLEPISVYQNVLNLTTEILLQEIAF